MRAIGDLLADVHDRDGVAFSAAGRSTDYSDREFATAAWKAGNLLSHYGVHDGATVAVLVGSSEPDDVAGPGRLRETPEPLFAVFGAWLLGATVDLDPGERIEGAAVVGPPGLLGRHDVAPGCTRLAYGESPTDPATGQFERERWSENPVEPPNHVSPDSAALTGDGRPTQMALLEDARAAVSDGSIVAGDRVGIDATLGRRTLTLGVLAPLIGEAIISGGQDGAVDVRVTRDGAVRLSG